MEHIHGGNLEAAKIKYNLKEEDILDFSANINFLGPPQGLLKGIKDNLNKIIHYPEPNSTHLKGKMSHYLNLNIENLTIGNGAVELIYQLVRVLKPKLALVLAPTFSEYELAVRGIEGKVKYLQLARDKAFNLDLDELILELDQVEMVFICNPNNPTGSLFKRSELLKLIDYASKKDIYVIIDEAFIDFIDYPENYTVIDLIKGYKNLFVLRSLTKFYAIPGLRLGYGVGEKGLVNELEMARDPWSVNCFAQLAGEEVLKNFDYREKTRQAMRLEREFLYNSLKEINKLKPYPPSANYIFVDLTETGLSSKIITEGLARRGILIRDCSNYHGLSDNFIRVAVRDREANNCLLKNLKDILEKM